MLGGLLAGVVSAGAQATPAPSATQQISESAQQQIRAIVADKQTRSAAQRKISSSLLYAAKARRGERLAASVPALRSRVPVAADGRVDVEIFGQATKDLVETIEKIGGEILYGHDRSSTIRALVPADKLEALGELSVVRHIRPTSRAITHRQLRDRISPTSLGRPGRTAPSFESRAAVIRTRLGPVLDRLTASRAESNASPVQRTAVSSQGDVAHGVQNARNFFGVTGAGVKIGVLSDSVDFLAQSQASRRPACGCDRTPGTERRARDRGEGTAMLEIVHDLAPGAKLFFATAFNSDAELRRQHPRAARSGLRHYR